MAPNRTTTVSSFTIIKGAMIPETYEVFAAWDFSRSKRENLELLRRDNPIGARSATWLRDVAKVLNRRFDPAGRDRALVVLAQGGLPLQEWKPILLWHMTRDEFLLRDFLVHWLYTQFEDGALHVRPRDLDGYLLDIRDRGGVTEHDWSHLTRERVATGLLRAAADFGLLKGAVTKEFASYHLPDKSFLYLLYAMRDDHLDASKLVESPDWQMFLMDGQDVERELLRLHQFKKLHYEMAGTLVQLTLPNQTALEYATAV